MADDRICARRIAARSIGQLRKTGRETDRDLHLAWNSGIRSPIQGATSSCSWRATRRSEVERAGALIYERASRARDRSAGGGHSRPVPRRDAGELPLVAPMVEPPPSIDPAGCGSLSSAYSYVYDSSGEKSRTVQFRARASYRRRASGSTRAGFSSRRVFGSIREFHDLDQDDDKSHTVKWLVQMMGIVKSCVIGVAIALTLPWAACSSPYRADAAAPPPPPIATALVVLYRRHFARDGERERHGDEL
jgi:hypothetical protein